MPTITHTHGYAGGWTTLALINAGLAQSKGRGGGGWFLISLLIGPLATLSIVILKPVAPNRRRKREFDLDEFRRQ